MFIIIALFSPKKVKLIGGTLTVLRFTETDRNGPKRTYENTETDFYVTETDRNGLQWVLKRTRTDFSSYRNKLQWEPEQVGWGTVGTILISYVFIGR